MFTIDNSLIIVGKNSQDERFFYLIREILCFLRMQFSDIKKIGDKKDMVEIMEKIPGIFFDSKNKVDLKFENSD